MTEQAIAERTIEAESAPADAYMLPSDYIKRHPLIFSGLPSWRYFVKLYRDELVKAGALAAPTGRLLVIPYHFDSVVRAIGQRLAGTKLR